MPKIVGYVGETPPTGEQPFPWLPTLAVFAGAYGMLWIASRLRNRLVANPTSEFAPATLMKIREATRRARSGEAKMAPLPQIIKELSQLPPGRYTFDLDPEFPSRRRKYSRNRYRRYKNSTTMRGAFLSASRAADGSDSRHVLVDTMGEPTGDPASPYNAADPVVLGIYREDGEPVFLIHADSLTPPPELSKEARETRRGEKKVEQEARKERRAEREAGRQTRSEKAAEKREQKRLEREEREREKEQARIARAEGAITKIIAKAQEAAAKAVEEIRQAAAEAKAAGSGEPAAAPARTSRRAGRPVVLPSAARMAGAAPAPAPAPAQAPTAAPKAETATEPKTAPVTVERQEEAVRKVKQRLKQRSETSEERESLLAEKKISSKQDKLYRQMSPEDQQAYLAQKRAEADERAAQKKKEKAEKKTEPEPAGPQKLPAPALDWFYQRVAKAELAGIKFPENTIEGAVTAMGADQARIDFGTEVLAQASAPLAAQGIGLGDRIRISLVFDGEVPVNFALEKIAVEKKAEAKAEKKPGKTSRAKASKAKPVEQQAAQEAVAEEEAPVPMGPSLAPGLYFYVDRLDGRARVIDFWGDVSLVDASPFVAAGVKTNTLVEALKDPRSSTSLSVAAAPPERQPTPWQEKTIKDILRWAAMKRIVGAGGSKPSTSKPKEKTSRKVPKPKKAAFDEDEDKSSEDEGQLSSGETPSAPREWRAASFSEEAASEGGETFFEEEDEEGTRRSPKPRGTVFRTIAYVEAQPQTLRAAAEGLLSQSPQEAIEVLEDGSLRLVSDVLMAPSAYNQRIGVGKVRLAIADREMAWPVSVLRSSETIEVGDQVVVTARMDGKDVASAVIEIQRLGAPAPGEAKASATRTSLKKNSRASEQDPALYREFKRTINMSASEIERWRKNPQHRDASLPHIRAELPLLAQMKRTPMSKWTPKMWNKAMRAINFVKRHEAQMKVQGKRYGTGRLHATYKRVIGLLNWGRKTPGVSIKSVLSKKTSKGRKVSRNPGFHDPAGYERLSVMSWL